jgi:hypothetical protein
LGSYIKSREKVNRPESFLLSLDIFLKTRYDGINAFPWLYGNIKGPRPLDPNPKPALTGSFTVKENGCKLKTGWLRK